MSEREQYLQAMGGSVIESFDPELKRAFDVADNEVPAELKDPEKLKFQKGKLKLSGDGVFYTLQGEGPTMGEPATFVRTHICNLRCSWCDAYYTWNPKSEEFWTEPNDIDVKEVANMVRGSWHPPEGIQKRVVFTGGEPLIQQETIKDVIEELGDDWKVEFETNGTLLPDTELLSNPNVSFNCSPKLGNSDNSRRSRIRPEVIQTISSAEGGATFKFVVMQPEDLDEIQTDYIDGCKIPLNQVILMPQGVTADEVRMNAQNVVEYAKQKGFRLLGRLQNEIWGAKRGV